MKKIVISIMAGKLEANVLLNWNASRFIEHLKRCSLFL